MEKSSHAHRSHASTSLGLAPTTFGASNKPTSAMAPTEVVMVDSAWWIQVPGMPPLATIWFASRFGFGCSEVLWAAEVRR